MLRDYFGELTGGRLKPIRFVVLWILLVVLFVAFGVLVGASIGIAERLVGGDFMETQRLARESLALPGVIVVAVVFLCLALAKLNIIAKRARDVGLPGWLTAVLIAVLSIGTSQAASGPVAGSLGFLLLIILAVLPTGMLRRTT